MKPWKVILGVGAACATCCAVPLAAALTGAASLGAAGAGLSACAHDLAPLAGIVAGLGLVAAGWAAWHRRARHRAAPSPSCNGCCDVRRA